MQALRTENLLQYTASVHEFRSSVESLWRDESFKLKFSNYISDSQKILEKRVDRLQLDTSNCTFICSGKSAEVSVQLLNLLASRSENNTFRELVKNVVALNPNENEDMYSGRLPEVVLKLAMQHRKLFFFDEHAQDYLKASSYLTTTSNNAVDASFFIFAGNLVPRDVQTMGMGNQLIVATKDDQIREFMSSLGRLVSESNRTDVQMNRAKSQETQSLESDFLFGQTIFTSSKRE